TVSDHDDRYRRQTSDDVLLDAGRAGIVGPRRDGNQPVCRGPTCRVAVTALQLSTHTRCRHRGRCAAWRGISGRARSRAGRLPPDAWLVGMPETSAPRACATAAEGLGAQQPRANGVCAVDRADAQTVANACPGVRDEHGLRAAVEAAR